MTTYQLLEHQAGTALHRFLLELPLAPLHAARDEHLQALQSRTRLPGFRPGKAPLAVLRRAQGGRVLEELLAREGLRIAAELIREHALSPLGRPRVTVPRPPAESDASAQLQVELEVMPQVQLAAVGDIALRHYQLPESAPELQQQADQLLQQQLFDALEARHRFVVPAPLVAREHDKLLRGYQETVGEVPDADTLEMLKSIAERRVRLAMVLTEIGRAEGIRVSRDELTELVEAQAQRSPEHSREVVDYYLSHPQALAELQAPLFERQVVAFLLEQCAVEREAIGADAFLARVQADGA